MILLSTEVKFITGVGPKRSALLAAEIDVRDVEDLITYYPYKYIDRTKFYTIREIKGDMPYIQLKGQILDFELKGAGRAQRLIAHFADETGRIELVWFKGAKWIQEKYHSGTPYIVFGKPSEFGSRYNIVHPEIEIFSEENVKKFVGWQAFYNTTEKMKENYLTSTGMRKIIFNCLNDATLQITETLPEYLIKQFSLMPRDEALRNIHFPQNPHLLQQAERRLKFEELFFVQLSILLQTQYHEEKFSGYVFSKIGDYFNHFYSKCLPFELTNAQKRVLKEIRADVGSGKQMNRLLQGDVGSGKTMVALMAALMAIDNGFQACIMAPTEILATQHYQSIESIVRPLGLEIRLLTGSTKKKERDKIAEGLQTGSTQIIIGTHALIEDSVQFKNLGLVVIDEQHRFGVAQRAKLWDKNTQPPHILVMTATPIPRTLAMTVYGDLDVSVIDELPPGRKPIVTYHIFDNKRKQLYNFLKKEIDAGRQVYVVYPLISESENLDFKNLEEGYEAMCKAFPEYKISMVHGRLKPDEKEQAMQAFVKGETQIMMATTVIEVGVNVPNASVMVIESAERFGLAQLHQLRGRVGRGSDQSYCILMSSYKISDETRKRLQIMVDSNDGFQIAEADLTMRGPGDISGTQQSGLPFNLKIANIVRDSQILQVARNTAKDLLHDDPKLAKPEHVMLKYQLKRLQKDNVDWGNIS